MRRIGLLLALVVSILLVNPLYEYPVGDDWTYALPVQYLLETGRLRVPDESATSLIAQVLWGALFCMPLGFSFSALHLSTLVLSLAGVWAFYRLCILWLEDEPGASGLAPLAALTLWFNPIYFTLSFTFFTDVPFLALCLLALYFFARSRAVVEARREFRYLVLGALFSTAALLVRQYAILLPVAFALSLWGREEARGRAWRCSIALGIPLLVLFGFYAWLVTSHGMPTQFRFAQLEMLKTYRIAHDLRHLPFLVFFYLGVFAFPLLGAVRFRHGEPGEWRRILASILALGSYATYMFLAERRLMPYLGDSAIFPSFGPWGGAVLTALAVWGGALLLVALMREGQGPWEDFRNAHARALRIGAGVLALIALLLALGMGREFLLERIERALIWYYHSYTQVIPSRRGLEYWRQRVEDFYIGMAQIIYGLALLGVLGVLVLGKRSARPSPPVESVQKSWQRWRTTFLMIWGLLLVGFFILISCRFDRYLLIFLPVGLLGGVRWWARRIRKSVAVLLLVGLGWVPVATAKTMIAGYGAVWRAGQALLARGIPIEEINLNYTFNAWMLYQQGKRTLVRTGQPSYWVYAARPDFRYWGERPDAPAEVILEVPYWDFLRWRRASVRVWRVRDR